MNSACWISSRSSAPSPQPRSTTRARAGGSAARRARPRLRSATSGLGCRRSGGVVDRLGRQVVDLGQPGDGGRDEVALVGEVAPGDQLARRVVGQPVAGRPDQLVDLVGRDPVVLGGVEDRAAGRRGGRARRRAPACRSVAGRRSASRPTRAPSRRGGAGSPRTVQPSGSKRSRDHLDAARGRHDRHAHLERQGLADEVGPGVAAPAHRGAEDLAQRDGEHRRGGVRAIVDVLPERERVAAVAACRAPARPGRPRAAARPCSARRWPRGRRRAPSRPTRRTAAPGPGACAGGSRGRSRPARSR